jgi:hypothetical protein
MRLQFAGAIVKTAGFLGPIAVLLAAASVSGCATSFVDAEGRTRVIGFVNLTLDDAAPDSSLAGTVVSFETFGVSAGRVQDDGLITIGYFRAALARIRNNALVVGNPVTELEEVSRAN